MIEFRADFEAEEIDPRLRWFNPPAEVAFAEGRIRLVPRKGTDFWQKTYYGFQRDSGHLLYLEISGDFAVETHAFYRFVGQFDQGGLMVRGGPESWIKFGIENRTDAAPSLSEVFTAGASDWSMRAFWERDVFLRIKRVGDVFGTYASRDGETWELLRLGGVPMPQTVAAGIFVCSPETAGSAVDFDYLRVWDPEETAFH